MKTGTYQEWLEYTWDQDGNLTGISDFSGMKIQYQRDASGDLAAIQSNRGAVRFTRNQGKVQSVETSQGYLTSYQYDPKGDIRAINFSKGNILSSLKFRNGMISELSGSDGSRYSVEYYPGPVTGLVRKITTPLNTVEYKYTVHGELQNAMCNNRYETAYEYDDSGRITRILINARE